jgi:hypothetical protein
MGTEEQERKAKVMQLRKNSTQRLQMLQAAIEYERAVIRECDAEIAKMPKCTKCEEGGR